MRLPDSGAVMKSLTILPVAIAGMAMLAGATSANADDTTSKKTLYSEPTFSSWKSNVKDGASSATYGTRLPTEFETKIGVDVGVASGSIAPDTDKLINRSTGNGNSGSAWATLAAPTGVFGIDASSNAKLDSASDQSKLGLGLSRKLSIHDDLQMKLKSDYGVTNALPAAAAPAPGAQSVGSSVGQTWETRRAVEFDLLRTDTSITAGQKLTTGEEKWLRSLSAEQKIAGPLSITGGVSETATGILDKSIKAGFKTTW